MLGLTLIILFEQVKALLGSQRVTGEVWVPALASPVAFLWCAEGPDGWKSQEQVAESGQTGQDTAEATETWKRRRGVLLVMGVLWIRGVMVPEQGAATGKAMELL